MLEFNQTIILKLKEKQIIKNSQKKKQWLKIVLNKSEFDELLYYCYYLCTYVMHTCAIFKLGGAADWKVTIQFRTYFSTCFLLMYINNLIPSINRT